MVPAWYAPARGGASRFGVVSTQHDVAGDLGPSANRQVAEDE